MNSSKKLIFHLDLDAFFCQCEIIQNPFLEKIPFVVARPSVSNKGVIETSNYLARKYGIYSAMHVWEAKKLYPYIRVVPPKHALYQKYSNIFFNYLKAYTDRILIASIDEAYIDLSEHELKDKPILLARNIQYELLNLFNLSVSIGISDNLYLAKMASDIKKPQGITTLFRKEKDKILDFDLKKVIGIGKKTLEKLNQNNFFYIKDYLDLKNKDKLINLLGYNFYSKIYLELNGEGTDFIDFFYNYKRKSISKEKTLLAPLQDKYLLLTELKETIKSNLYEINSLGLRPYLIWVILKDAKDKRKTKQIKLKNPAISFDLIYPEFMHLFEKIYNSENEYILIGSGFGSFQKEEKDYTLFNDITEMKINNTLNKLPNKIRNKIKRGE